MIRPVVRAGLFLLLTAAVMDRAGFGQAPSAGPPDKIVYRDRKSDAGVKTVTGQLKESLPGVYQVISSGKAVTENKAPLELTAADIVRVLPGGDLAGFPRDRLLDLDGTETGKDYAKAKPGYEAALKGSGLNAVSKRYIETRLNLLRARLLEEADDAARTAEAPKLSQDLAAFMGSYAKGWEVWPVGRALARLQMDEGKFADARRTWSQLAKNESLAKDLRDEAGLREVDATIRDGKFGEAASRATEIAKTASTESVKDRLAIYQAASKGGATEDPAAAIKEIEVVIGRTKDPLARAAGYAMIGELNFAAKKMREAMWAYLWVEVVFNQDRDEVLNAMARLGTIFEALGEKERAESYKERMRKYRLAT